MDDLGDLSIEDAETLQLLLLLLTEALDAAKGDSRDVMNFVSPVKTMPLAMFYWRLC